MKAKLSRAFSLLSVVEEPSIAHCDQPSLAGPLELEYWCGLRGGSVFSPQFLDLRQGVLSKSKLEPIDHTPRLRTVDEFDMARITALLLLVGCPATCHD